MANRRKFLAGLGALASGSAAAVGTGAFTSVQANRTVSVTTASDNSAQLAFQPSGSTNSSYVDGAGAGEITINADDLNRNGTIQINDIFEVANQGTQPVVVYVDPASIPTNERTSSSGFGIDPQATNRPHGDYTKDSAIASGVEDDQISLTGNFNSPPYDYTAYRNNGDNHVRDSREEFVVESGESFEFGLYVNTPSGGSVNNDVNIEIVADATVVPDNYADDPDGS